MQIQKFRWPARTAFAVWFAGLFWLGPHLAAASLTRSAPPVVAVETLASGCGAAQTTFILGGTVCARVSGIDPLLANARFDFVDPDGIIQQRGPDITSDGQSATFMLPVSGAAAKPGVWHVNIAYNSDSSVIATATFTAMVCPAFTLSPLTLPNPVAGTSYNQAITASPAGSYSFAIMSGAAPPGLSLNTNGAWSGAPTALGSYACTVMAQDSLGCTASRSYTLAVACPAVSLSPATLPNADLGSNYNQTLTAAPGGASYSFAVSAGGLPPGLSLSSNGLLSGAPNAVGNFTFTVSATSFGACVGTRTYSILVTGTCATITLSPASLPGGTVGAAYNQIVSAAGGAGPYTLAVTAGALPGGLSLSSGGSLSGTPTASGTFNFTITATGAGGCTGSQGYALTIACAASTWQPASLPGAQVGVAYSQTVSATNATGYSLLSGSLPAGLSLNAATGGISGIATMSGTYNFTLRANGAGGCNATQAYSLAVSCPSVTLTPGTLPGGTVGTAYNQSFGATPAGSYSFTRTSGTLPPGLSLSTAGVLSGTPTTAGTYSFTVTATGFGTCTGSQTYTVTITASCTTIALPSLAATGKVGVNYYGNLAGTTPSGSYTFSLESGTLPPGVVLDNLFAALVGKPAAAGTYTFTLKATRSNGCTGTRSYTVTISN
jgi:large repetitive protein